MKHQNESPFKEASLLCKAIHGEYSFDLVTFKRKAPTVGSTRDYGLYLPIGHYYGTFEDHAKNFPSFTENGIEPFAIVACTDGQGVKNENVTQTWALAIDFDKGYPSLFRWNCLVSPSLLVETSVGHFQAVWILVKPIDPDKAKAVLSAMAQRLGGDPAHAKVSQLIRLPGFLNQKRGFVSKLVETKAPKSPYKIEYLRQAFDVDFIVQTTRTSIPRFNSDLRVKKDSLRPDDLDEVATDVESALEFLKDHAEAYSDWLPILMALVPLGDRGRQLAEKFSRASSEFDQVSFDKKWQQIQGHPGSVGTVFLLAQRNGWKNPGYRHTTIENPGVLTDRDFARMIAAEMGDDYAAITKKQGEKEIYYLLRWNNESYEYLDNSNCRSAVELIGNQVVNRLAAANTVRSEVIQKLKHKLGNNSSLNEACQHVTEMLAPISAPRQVGAFPYFAVGNGVLNLITQELIPALFRPVPSRNGTSVPFDPSASAPRFHQALKEIFQGKSHLIRYFGQVFGYALRGKPVEQILLVLIGPSSGNGKNTITEALETVFSSYAMTLPVTSIMMKSHVSDGATPSLARLEGKRLAFVSEPDEKHTLDASLVKQMTGDRCLSIRENYGPNREIPVEFLLVMRANFVPKLKHDDDGMWRRLRFLPFERRFTSDEMDRELADTLAQEKSGILNFLLAGHQDYAENGLITPEEVKNSGDHHRSEVDSVGNFLKDTMITGVKDCTAMKTIYPLYEQWAKQYPDDKRLSKQKLGDALVLKEHRRVIKGHLPYFEGLRPIEVPD